MKILLILGFIISYCFLFSQSTFVEGRGANGQGLWAENVAGISTLTTTSFGVSADYKFGLSELTNAQIRIAKPYQFGVLLLQWNSLGNTHYNVNEWALSLAKNLSPSFVMGLSLGYKREQIGYDNYGGLLADFGVQYQISHLLSASSVVYNPFRQYLEPSAFHLGLKYVASDKVNLAISMQKTESLPTALVAQLHYEPSSKIILFTSLSTQANNNAFGIAFLWHNLCIDTYLAYHYYLGFSPQMALTYNLE
ncbi:MAG: hypothetical protein ISP71_06430 [Flavobacteriales bacterium]|nr:hypothetical protein [Flavobacteriales bacterium]